MTTAETILLEQQSVAQFFEKLSDTSKNVVVTLSNQSLSSMSANIGMDPTLLRQKLCGSLKSRGVRAVFDLSVASQIALLENCHEFDRRLHENSNLPMMTSSCPGWVCYVEKSQPHLLPYISSIKSPQAIMGTLIKQFWHLKMPESQESIFHVTVMPCYDKKLESAREELMSGSIPDTDCVLTTAELERWIKESNIDLLQESGSELDVLISSLDEDMDTGGGECMTSGEFIEFGSSDSIESDGYMNYLVRRICLQNSLDLPNNCIPFRHGKNSDIQESSLILPDGRELHFAIINGFRNIQGLVRRTKSKRCTYHYVEVMACPSGCINGGGQIAVNLEYREDANVKMKESLLFYTNNPTDLLNATIQRDLVYKEWIHGHPGSMNALHQFSTTYKERRFLSVVSNVDW